MILTGSEIRREVLSNRIVIDPFDESCLNPNSYNYHLGNIIKTSPSSLIDPREKMSWIETEISEDGFLLEPSRLYLGHTIERIGSSYFVTSLIGRSSVGRLGLYLQLSADLAQLGAVHCWTLELYVVQPLWVYKGMAIGQVSFWTPVGNKFLYEGVYGNSSAPLEHQFVEETKE